MAPQLANGLAQGRVAFLPMQMRAVFDYVASQAFDVVHCCKPRTTAMESCGSAPTSISRPRRCRARAALIAEVNEASSRRAGCPLVPERSFRRARAHAASAHAVPRRRRPTPRRSGSPSTSPRSSRDGDCIQTGIGAIPAAILAALANKNDLGHALGSDRRRRHGVDRARRDDRTREANRPRPARDRHGARFRGIARLVGDCAPTSRSAAPITRTRSA